MDINVEESGPIFRHRFDQQGSVQEQIARFAARLRDEEATVTGGTMGRAIVFVGGRVMIRTHGIAAADLQPLERAAQHRRETLRHLDQAA